MTTCADLACAEHYWILLCAATEQRASFDDPRLSAGAVLLGLRDLQSMSCIAPTREGKLEPFGGAERRKHVNSLLMAVFDKRLSEEEWVNRLCLSPTSRVLRSFLAELTASTARKANVRLASRGGFRGLFSGSRVIDRGDPALLKAARQSLSWLASLGRGRASVLRMLDLAGAIDRLREIDDENLAAAFSVHEGSREWRSCEEVVVAVENADFMGAVLSGAL